ncbi:ABC transporter ATP-binding protein [Carnobacterium divergens]|uniref:ABC transporter ATP-binding protein n=1 Tax=Carnobacterium divergens TaxID=2748 RepID=A0AAW8RCX3_CARDV|nr:ABC transporter ATP-binding protein [Carnobacterium divergens]MDT1958994.1 ABC transporter ATP-binding protein [Carnobacterium divergens]MDT1974962.1 ABC transporter ATP-binding protein [Carnobacterium divergens]MDT2012926.1 ABC transporter ATP-binding protein [Carnobacterium divergens]
MNNKVIVEVKDLKRSYKAKGKNIEALKGVSFEIYEGEIFGLLGPNGAGKSTTIKILSTLLAPTEGIAKVFGYDCFGKEKQIRPQINFVFGGERGLYWRLSAYENLVYFGTIYKIPSKVLKMRIPQLIELVGLNGREHEKVEGYSKGMKQRLQIARGLINDPEMLFLDEPTIGLDPVGANDLRNLIKNLKKQGKTILLTTHYMQEADDLCDRIAFINKGKILDIGTTLELKEKHMKNKNSILEEVYLKLVKD